jgi:hypothetical protein
MRLRFLPCLALWACCAHADPGYYLLTPYDQAGVLTAELRYWTVKPQRGSEATWPEAGLGWGVNRRWTTRLLASWIGGSHEATRLATLNWQNSVLLTQGEGPVDVALHLQRIWPQGGGQQAMEYGLVMKTELGFVHVNFNLVLENTLGAGAPPTRLKLQWQLQQRITPGLHAGLLGFDELGTWKDWAPHASQSHRAGPVLISTWPRDELRALTLQAAWLVGKTYGRTGSMFTLRAAADF